MADEITPPAAPSALTQVVVELAAAAGMTPQEFIFGGVGLVLAPFEKEIADRLFALMAAKFTATAEIGVKNDTLEKQWDSTAHSV